MLNTKIKILIISTIIISCAVIFIMPVCLIHTQDAPSNDIMPIAEVKRNMIGKGYSVFSGFELESFDAHILGVVDIGLGDKLIMTTLSNNSWVEDGGISQGMSGSPVYIDDKLIGAVAMTYKWSKEPIGFIRPIEEMLELDNISKQINKSTKKNIRFIPLLQDTESKFWLDYVFDKTNNNDITDNENSTTPHKIQTPLIMSGFSDNTLSLLSDEFNKIGFNLINVGGIGSETSIDYQKKDLNAGDIVVMQFMRGDLNAYSIGTVSYRKDDKVLMFGHKAYSVGEIDIPIATGYVYTTVPSQQISFKYGAPVEEVGRAVFDFDSGVLGEIGSFAEMVPVSVDIKNIAEDKTSSYNFEMIHDHLFFPNLLVNGIIQSLASFIPAYQEHTVKFSCEMKVENKDTGEIDTVYAEDFVSSNTNQLLVFTSLFRIIQPAQFLMNNYYNDTRLISVDFDAEVDYKMQVMYIEDIIVPDNKIYAGKEIDVILKMSSKHQKHTYKTVKVKIPDNAKEGDRVLIGASSKKNQVLYYAKKSPGLFKFYDYESMIDVLNIEQDFNKLCVWVEGDSDGISFDENNMPDLPDAVLKILKQKDNSTFYTYGYTEPDSEVLFDTNYLVNSSKYLYINLEKKGITNE